MKVSMEEDQWHQWRKKRALQIAREVLNGHSKALDAARELCPILHSERGLVSEKDLIFIVAIDSEIDDLPIGRIRDEWHPDFLADKDREIARCEGLWHDSIRAICEGMLLREEEKRKKT